MVKTLTASELEYFAEIVQSCYREDGLGVEHVAGVVPHPDDSDYKLIYRSEEGLFLYAREIDSALEEERLYDSFIVELKQPFSIDGVDTETCEQIVRILGMR